MIFAEYVEQQIETADILSEGMFKKAMVRKGKKVIKWKTTRPGKYRIQFDKNGKPKEVRITATEKRKRKRGRILGKIKSKAKAKVAALFRHRSEIARRNAGLAHYDTTKNPTQNPSRDEANAKKGKKAKATAENNDRGMK